MEVTATRSAQTAMATILDGRAIAKRLKEELKQDLARLGAARQPQLAIIYFDSPASTLYYQAQCHAARELGITLAPDLVGFSYEEVTPRQLGDLIQGLNATPSVHGIFVHQPLPPHIDAQWISTLIDPRKDVEGIHPQNSARRFFAKARIGSCTALAVMELIEATGVDLRGTEAVVVGHSEIVGRPVSMLLLDRLATTTVCHVATDQARKLEEHVRRADVLVVAIGRPGYITGEWIKAGAIVIDVGINVVDRKVVGDVDFASAKARAGWITPVPGGVGPVTVMMVMKNTVEAFKLQQGNHQ